MKPTVQAFFDEATFTVSYVVAEPAGRKCAIIDSVQDFDPNSGRTSTKSAECVIEYVRKNELEVQWILETHVHADHLSAAVFLQENLGGLTGIGEHVTDVQATFKKVFNAEHDFAANGSQFDRLFAEDEEFEVGKMSARAIYTPGHTPACVTYLIGDAAFVGDTMFMPDYGSARTDFPGGDAATLYRSIQKIFSLPNETRLFMCHDYLAPGRDQYEWQTTVAEQRAKNIHVGNNTSETEFVAMRTERDKTLAMPALILPAVQVNMRAGHLPPPEGNGVPYLKIPLNLL